MSPHARRRGPRYPGSPLAQQRLYQKGGPQLTNVPNKNVPRSKSLDTGLDECIEEVTPEELIKECEEYLAESNQALNTTASEDKGSEISETPLTPDLIPKVERPTRRRASRNKSFEKRSRTKTESSSSQSSLRSEDDTRRKKSILNKMKSFMK